MSTGTLVEVNKLALQKMDEKADKIIAGWTFGALAANLLPPPFDYMAVGAAFARMGARLGEVYEISINWGVLKAISKAIAKGVGGTLPNEMIKQNYRGY